MTSRILLLLSVILISCNDSVPSGLIQPAKMQAIMWDVTRAEAFAQEIAARDSTKKVDVENARLLAQVFAIHKTSREIFDKSYSWYAGHPDLMKVILDSINAQQTRLASVAATADVEKKDSTIPPPVATDTIAKPTFKDSTIQHR